MHELTDPQVRLSSRQREHALALLREAAADERLTFEELSQRLPRAMAAVTRGELFEVVGDLDTASRLQAMFDEPLPLGDGPGLTWEHPLTLVARDAWWSWKTIAPAELPPFVELVVRGAATLFCTRAQPLTSLIDLVVTGSGYVRLIVPEGWGVGAHPHSAGALPARDGSSGIGGAGAGSLAFGLEGSGVATSLDTAVPSRPSPGHPRVVVSWPGTIQLTVRHPKRSDLRVLARHDRRAQLSGR